MGDMTSVSFSRIMSHLRLVTFDKLSVPGQERQRRLFRVYYRDANGCLLLFDLTNPQSLAHVQEWKEELDRHCALPNGNTIPCLLLVHREAVVFSC